MNAVTTNECETIFPVSLFCPFWEFGLRLKNCIIETDKSAYVHPCATSCAVCRFNSGERMRPMSRLLQQQSAKSPTDVGSSADVAPAQIPSRSVNRPDTIAGIPLLMRLPNLKDTAESDESAQVAISEPSLGDEPKNDVDSKDSAAQEAGESTAPPAPATKAKRPAWKFALWQPVVGLALIGLFIISWIMLSNPGGDEAPAGDDDVIDELVITEGIEISADELAKPSEGPISISPPPPNVAASPSPSVTDVQPPPSSPPPSHQPDPSPAPPELGLEPSWNPPAAGQGDAGFPLGPQPPANATTNTAPARPVQETAPSYPHTDPATYIYPAGSGESGVARRPAQPHFNTNAPPPVQPR